MAVFERPDSDHNALLLNLAQMPILPCCHSLQQTGMTVLSNNRRQIKWPTIERNDDTLSQMYTLVGHTIIHINNLEQNVQTIICTVNKLTGTIQKVVLNEGKGKVTNFNGALFYDSQCKVARERLMTAIKGGSRDAIVE